MTREDIEKDLAHFRSQRETHIANANAVSGVVQYLETKLAELVEQPRVALPSGADISTVEKTKR